jgi:hypothetical protein
VVIWLYRTWTFRSSIPAESRACYVSDSLRRLRERYPIAAPALEATYHFSKKQLLMNLILAVVAIPVSVYYGLIPWFQLRATIKVIVVVYMGLLVLTAIYNFARSPLQLLCRNHRDIVELRSELEQLKLRSEGIGRLPTAATHIGRTEPLKDPNIVYESSDVVDAHRGHRGFIMEGMAI